jgi:thymidylate synthase
MTRMSRFLKTGNPLDAWKLTTKTVMEYGNELTDERGSRIKEVLGLIVNIKNPTLDLNHSYWYGEKLKIYQDEFMESAMKGFVYTYGNRIGKHFGINQLESAVERLNNNNHTRRSIVVTFDPVLDNINQEIPCIIAIDFKIRKNKLETTAFWRSNDIFGAYYPNVMGLSRVIEYVSACTDSDIGTLTTHAASAHIYETNWQAAGIEVKRVVKRRVK